MYLGGKHKWEEYFVSRADIDGTVDMVISPHSLRVAGRCRDEFSVVLF